MIKMCLLFYKFMMVKFLASVASLVRMKKTYLSTSTDYIRTLCYNPNSPSIVEEKVDIEQRTVSRCISFCGVGLHTGELCKMTILPAPANTGYVFRRSGCSRGVQSCWNQVVDSRLSTVLGEDRQNLFGGTLRQNVGIFLYRNGFPAIGKRMSGQTFHTVEHILAAMYGADVDNAIIELSSDEVPIMDGSSLLFAQELAIPNTVVSIPNTNIKVYRVVRRVEVSDGGNRSVSIGPLSLENTASHDLKVTVYVDFGDRIQEGAGGSQKIEFWRRDFAREVAAARTFCFLDDLEAMRRMRLSMGGSLDNALVFSEGRILNSSGLRFPDEVVRHKALDAIGDLRLGGRLIGHYIGIRPGHALNLRLLRKLFTGSDY